MELTKEHFDKVLRGLASKEDLKAIKADVAAIKTGMVRFATQESLEELGETVAQIKSTQDNNTSILEKMATEKKNKDENKTVDAHRFDRLEHWAGLVGKKLGIKLEL